MSEITPVRGRKRAISPLEGSLKRSRLTSSPTKLSSSKSTKKPLSDCSQTNPPSGKSSKKHSSVTSPSKNSSGKSSKEPSSVASPSKPSPGKSSKKPLTVTSPSKPSSGKSSKKPSTVTSPSKPSSGKSSKKPSTAASPSKSSSGKSSNKPLSVTSPSKPSSGKSSKKSSSDCSQTKPSSGKSSKKSSSGSSSSKASDGVSSANSLSTPKKNHKKTDNVKKSNKNSKYDHLSENERTIVIGFSPSPQKVRLVDLTSQSPKNVSVEIDSAQSRIKPVGSLTEPVLVSPLVSVSNVSSSQKNSPSVVISSSFSSPSIISISTPPPLSSQTKKIGKEIQKNQLNSSILMQVQKGDKLVYVDPFRRASPVTTPNVSNSVIVVEDSPVPPAAPRTTSSLSTSTPRASIEPSAFNVSLFPFSPIATSAERTVQAPSFSLHASQSFAGVFSNSVNSTVIEKDMPCTVSEKDHSDEEDMEVDDEYAMTTLVDVRENTILMETEIVGILTETVTHKSTFIDSFLDETLTKSSEEDDIAGHTVLAIDTNIFIHCLKFVKDALIHPMAASGQLLVLLPWVVLQELDYLKLRIRDQVMAPVRFINKQLLADNPSLISQSPQQAMEKLIPIESNDDKILICCLQRMASHKDRVILVTRDINLSSKARVAGIESADNNTLWRMVAEPTPTPTNTVSKTITNTATQKKSNAVTNTAPAGNVGQNNAQYNCQNNNPTIQHQSDTVMVSNITKMFFSIWDYIDNNRCQIERDLRLQMSHPAFQKAVNLASSMCGDIASLHHQFHRCLMMSPFHLWNHRPLFNELQHKLDVFYVQCNAIYRDAIASFCVEDMIHYFEDTHNRPTLFNGLRQLEDSKKYFQRIRQEFS